ncbi:MAG: molecular chaperone GrpE [Thermoleophilaceae bacterium]|nr:molecular chaperone GrpE [Thermoleophilaceae bacterium]
MNRPRPEEDAVRKELRDEHRLVDEGNGAKATGEEPVAEAAEPQEEPAAAEEVVEEDELTVARRERDEYLDLAKRAQADFENYRKRASKDIAASGARARAGLIRELLPVVDNLERALVTAPDDDPMADGVRLVLRDMQGVLVRAGVQSIEPRGEQFDPNVHEALTTRQEEGVEAGIVLDVVEKGYRGADQVIRPARVIVAA